MVLVQRAENESSALQALCRLLPLEQRLGLYLWMQSGSRATLRTSKVKEHLCSREKWTMQMF